MRGITRYVEDLVRSRRPRRFAATEDAAGLARTAITLRAARPGSGAPRDEFVLALHKKLAAGLDPPGPGQAGPQGARQAAIGDVRGRRSFLRAATVAGGVAVAGGAALAGAGVEHALTAGPPAPAPPGPESPLDLVPDDPTWHTVALSAELLEGMVRSFTAGAVTGFVSRSSGRLLAVSGICTHQGCLLILAAPPAAAQPVTAQPTTAQLTATQPITAQLTAARPATAQLTAARPAILACPCHGATFSIDGAVLSHRLRVRLTRLPELKVREAGGDIQVYVPRGSE